MKKTILLFMIFGFVFSFNSCKKYEENELPSFRTAKARICREWVVQTTSDNQINNLLNSGYIYREFNKDYTYKETVESGTNTYVYYGNWEFASNKEYIIISIQYPIYDSLTNEITEYVTYIDDAKIIKLTKNEFVYLLTSEIDNSYVRYELVASE